MASFHTEGAEPPASVTPVDGSAAPSFHSLTGSDALVVGSIQIGTVTAGASPAVTNSGTTNDAILDFVLPQGPKGDPGAQGIPGTNGTNGAPGADAANPAYTYVINTLAPGAPATLAATGTYPNVTLTFGIPKGDTGAQGPAGQGLDVNGQLNMNAQAFLNGHELQLSAAAVGGFNTINLTDVTGTSRTIIWSARDNDPATYFDTDKLIIEDLAEANQFLDCDVTGVRLKAANTTIVDVSSNGAKVLGKGVVTSYTPEQFGAKGDGTTNDTVAFQNMAAAIQTDGGGTINLRPGAVYIVGLQTLVNNGTRMFSGQDVFYVHNLSKKLTINGNGATIRFAAGLKYGSFDSTGTRTDHAQPYTGGDQSSIIDNLGGIFSILECTAMVTIRDIEFDGNIANISIGGPVAADSSGYQLGGDGIVAQYNVGGMYVENVHAHDFPRDGGLIGSTLFAKYGDTGDDQERYPHTFVNCKWNDNCRNCFSVEGGRGFKFINNVFAKYPTVTQPISTGPNSACDVEAELGAIRDVCFDDCFFHGGSTSLVADAGDTEGVYFNRCRFDNPSSYSFWFNKPRIVCNDCIFFGGGLLGDPTDLQKAAEFNRCHFTENPADSVSGLANTFVQDGVQGAGGGAQGNNAHFTRCTWDYGYGTSPNGAVAVHGSILEDCYISTVGMTLGNSTFRGNNTVVETDGANWFSVQTGNTYEDELTHISTGGATTIYYPVKPRIVAESAVAASHTGDTVETTLATITVPGHLVGPNGRIEVQVRWSMSGAGGNRTLRVKFGTATLVAGNTGSSITNYSHNIDISNRGATNSQYVYIDGKNSSAAGLITTGTEAIDTTQDQTIALTGQLAVATDTVTVESYRVLVLPQN